MKSRTNVTQESDGTTINYSDCLPGNGDETISFVCLFNVLYQLQWLHNDKCYMAELVQTTDRGERTRTKNFAVIRFFSQSWKLLRGVGCGAGEQL
jgi:hypothetical protein